MFCTKCGKEISDDSQFCIHCGAEQTPMDNPLENKKINTTTKKSGFINKKLIVGIVGIAIIILAFTVIKPMITGRSVEKTLDMMMEGYNDRDGKKILEILPGEMIDKELEDAGMTKEELKKTLDVALIAMKNKIQKDVGKDYTLDYEILSEKDYTDQELIELNNTLSEKGIQKDKATEAKDVKLKIVCKKGSKEVKTYDEESTIQMIKIKKNWYVNLSSVSSL